MFSVGKTTKNIRTPGGTIESGSVIYPVEMVSPVFIDRGIIIDVKELVEDENQLVWDTNVADGKTLFSCWDEDTLILVNMELVKEYSRLLKRIETMNPTAKPTDDKSGGRESMIALLTEQALRRRELTYHTSEENNE